MGWGAQVRAQNQSALVMEPFNGKRSIIDCSFLMFVKGIPGVHLEAGGGGGGALFTLGLAPSPLPNVGYVHACVCVQQYSWLCGNSSSVVKPQADGFV